MSQLRETNQTLDFFCDFDKISKNVDDIKLSLCMLNSLVRASDLRFVELNDDNLLYTQKLSICPF